MEFWKAILGLARNKFIGVPVAVLAAALALAGYLALPERYVASASMVLVTPSGGGSIDRTKPVAQTNPLLQFSDDLRTTASILILAMNSPDVFKSVGVTEDGSTDLTIDDGRSNPTLLGVGTTGPFIYVQVESGTPAGATKVLAATQERLRQELDDRQNELKAHPITFVQLDDVVRLGPEADASTKLQGAVGGALFGLVAGFGVAYAFVRGRLRLPARLRPAPEDPPAETPKTTETPETPHENHENGVPQKVGSPNGRAPDREAGPVEDGTGSKDGDAVDVVSGADGRDPD
ncbi:hypothetical protein MF672_013070 [Actinomadura sp. ATCC 31491]|uniref:Polysaccharide chain length determinant N-terminal domain-containing protein n=1 Tax=Actinomadura luzonensis TaxID=2805427 RepID=A0ABT0FQV0_9ACTN|nr:hypothetical protein [Actinomadura luzonensis]MCK2214719.1 hypothetical protein [Actinomadura luzonensis]